MFKNETSVHVYSALCCFKPVYSEDAPAAIFHTIKAYSDQGQKDRKHHKSWGNFYSSPEKSSTAVLQTVSFVFKMIHIHSVMIKSDLFNWEVIGGKSSFRRGLSEKKSNH